MIGRTWPVAPARDVLQIRWNRLVTAPLKEKPSLLVEHKRDRTIHTQLSDNLPGRPGATTIAAETGTTPAPVRYGYRSFDRAWIIPDKRLINQPNPGLWQVRTAPGQVFPTGAFHAPHRPAIAGLKAFTGTVLHSSEYRSPMGWAGAPQLWAEGKT